MVVDAITQKPRKEILRKEAEKAERKRLKAEAAASEQPKGKGKTKSKAREKYKADHPNADKECFHCHKKGHVKSECRKLQAERAVSVTPAPVQASVQQLSQQDRQHIPKLVPKRMLRQRLCTLHDVQPNGIWNPKSLHGAIITSID